MNTAQIILLVTFFLAAAGPAQTTWNVSTSGALLQAFNSAQNGDTIVAASGFYNVAQGITTSKALTVVGQPGARLYGTGGGPTLTVQGLGAGQTFTLQGIEFTLGGYSPVVAFEFSNNAGAIHVSQCEFNQSCSSTSCASAFQISSCDLVTFSGCTIEDVRLEVGGSSRVAVSDCSLTGRSAIGSTVSSGRNATVGALVGSQSRVTFSQCTVTGGDGDIQYPGSTALALHGSGTIVEVAGDATSVFSVGAQGSTTTITNSAIETSYSGLLRISPNVGLVSHPGEPLISGPYQSSPQPTAVYVRNAAPGATATFDVIADPGDPAILFAGLPSAPWSLSPYGDVWVTQGSEFTLGVQVIGASGQWTHALQVVNDPALKHLAFHAQVLSGGVATSLRFSLPGPFVLQ